MGVTRPARSKGLDSAAYIRCLGIEETIAGSLEQYLEAAVRLGLNPALPPSRERGG